MKLPLPGRAFRAARARSSGAPVVRVFVFLLLSVVLLGCSYAPTQSDAPAQSEKEFNATDVAWLQLADALHTRALPLLGLVRGRAGSRALADLAARLGRKHENERARLRALLARARVTGENPHTQHDMPGMPTADALRTLTGLRDDAFDRRFVALLRAYLDQLVLVAEGEQSSGRAPEARELAAAMERDHTADLAELDRVGGPER
ncbi:DUF305 domain-containing protein [Nonomuraea angiospora]|uniref:DUF305 domain-containing protein n=1 Tax=Nonomuraea angiospora TaxID=46172 RepID=UPI0033EB90DF